MWRFLGFSGRIGRATWWMAGLIIAAITVGAWDDLAANFDRNSETEPTVAGLIAMVAILWISWSANVQRLHDHNKAATMSSLSFRWGHDLLIELGFRKGDEGPNDFGPPETPLFRWPSGRDGGDTGRSSRIAAGTPDRSEGAETPEPAVKAADKRAAAGGKPAFGRRTFMPR